MKTIKLFFLLLWANIKIARQWLLKTKLIRFMFRDKVDLIMLILSVMFVVLYFLKTPVISSDNFSDGNFSAWIAVLCLYLFGAIWRMGSFRDTLDQFVKDPLDRAILKLDIETSYRYEKIVTRIFFIFVIIMLVLIFFSLLNS